ncbi:hypothetical protein QR680_009008 [Steinernema hermaphroditum]|uniref:peptidylglycine monooxygenase n=1 Tax=Steinernema hermaphroditum TaxID=289476 RepID=A0AA39M8N4_9BILA|nr:hypothetical protein QR680_009008 [Steinernema hermaphroditum]
MIVAAFLAFLAFSASEKVEFRMPGVMPSQDEAYLCTSVPLDPSGDFSLVGFDPIANGHTAHHMLLFGCAEPGSEQPVWDCGEMTQTEADYLKASVCGEKPNILYAWAKDAPKLELPKGVGFKLAGDTNIRHLVLQVHYMHKLDAPDFSGVRLETSEAPVEKTAATLLMVTGGEIAPNSKESFETACVVDEDVKIHPFAFRVHAHSRGVSVGGWLVRESPDGEDHWQLIGTRDPQLPQMFVPVNDSSMVISRGDMLTSRCLMDNKENRVVKIGPTGADEMCNFYLMYWVEGSKTLRDNTCFSPGAPNYYWTSEAGLNHVPH